MYVRNNDDTDSYKEADRLAGEYQDELGAYSPITHMYSSSPAVLEINGMTITLILQK